MIATVSSETFLGIERSLTGRRWLTRDADDRSALALAQRLDLPEVVGRILAARDVGIDDAAAFLNPTLRASLPDPDSLKGMAEAVERLASAIMQGERIAVFGDYDVDGATSLALLRRYFFAVGSDIDIYIPDRRREGYGPNTEAMLGLREKGASVVVTVDCGTGAHEALAAAADAGLGCRLE